MNKNYYKFLLLWILSFGFHFGFGQTEIFNEAGGGGVSGWVFENNVTSNDIDRGSYWLVEDGTTNDFITTATYDLSSYTSAEFTLDVATFGSGTDNPAKIEFSFDGGSTYPQTEISNTPSSSTYINGGTFALNSVTDQVVIRITTNGTTGRDVRLQNLILTASGTSGGSCSLTNSGLANVSCNDNATASNTSDDFITFDLNPTGSNLGSTYNVSVSSGSITPTSANYGSATTFTLNNGSAGGGNVDITITDFDDATCTVTETIIDPGSCSSGGGGTSSCGVEIDFETQGSGYSTSIPEFNDNLISSGMDYFEQTSGISGILGADGSFFAAQDIDGEGATLPVNLTIDNIDISSLTNLEFSIDLAEVDDGTNEDWDDDDYVRVYYTIDSGPEQNLLWIESELSNSSNGRPLIDTDFDGVGDGTEITNTFTTFTRSIASSGSSMDIRIEFSLDSGDEDIAIDNITVCGTPASSNDNDSDIIVTNFDPTDDINYTLYNVSGGLTTTNAIKVGEFEIRDGGATASDADGVGTTLTDLDLDITNFENLEAIALFDGSTNVSEITAPSATTSFTSINSGAGLTAGDDGTKTFDVYVTFSSTVTDNQQLELSISNAIADGVNGSVFSAIDAGGASTPTILDDNRIEVTASDLIFDQNPTDVERLTVMSPSPTVIAADTNLNTDLDYTASVILTVNTTNFEASATTAVNASAGIATFDNLIFNSTSTGSTLTASSGALSNDTSVVFEVFTAPITIAIEDFDGTSPSWPNDISNQTFIDPSTSTEGFFIQPSTNIGSGNTAYGNDLGGESGEPTLSPYTFTFEKVNVKNFSNLKLSFDYYAFANADTGSYEIFIDDVSQGSVEFYNDPDTTPVQGTISESIGNASTISLVLTGTLNGGGDIIELDNFKIEGNYDGDLVYSAGNWSPNAPSLSTGNDDALVQDGIYTTTGDINLNSISVLGDASVEISSDDVLTINEDICNNGTFTLKSDALGTAQFKNATGVTVSSEVTVERFIPANRAFRFLSSPVTTSGTIYDNWQESGSTPTLPDGLGTHITGGSAANGFDQSGSNNPSMFTFNNSFIPTGSQTQADAWQTVTSTNQIGDNLNAETAYLLFVRGDRSIDLTDNSSLPNNTTLSATGELFTNSNSSQLLNDQPELFSLVANPFQAIVDFTKLTFTGLGNSNFMYVYDPSQLDYVTLDKNLSADVPNMFIRPGQSFFVVNNTGAATASTVEFEQADINTDATPGTTVFSNDLVASLELELYNDSDDLRENLRIRFEDNASNAVDNFDAPKLLGNVENLASVNDGNLYTIERRATIQDTDEVKLHLDQYQIANYEFRVSLQNWDAGIEIFVVDDYLDTQTAITPNQSYGFTVDTNIPESTAANRFSLKFDNATFSINDNTFGVNFSLYPNPTSNGQFSIKTPSLSGEVNIEITNVLGQQVSKQQLAIEGQQVNVNAGNLSTGVYIVKLSQAGQSFSAKLIVE